MTNNINKIARWAAVCGALAGSGSALADERFFTYVQDADVIPKGGWEFEQWVTFRKGYAGGDRDFNQYLWDFREEMEYGFTNKLSGALYLNFRQDRRAATGGGQLQQVLVQGRLSGAEISAAQSEHQASRGCAVFRTYLQRQRVGTRVQAHLFQEHRGHLGTGRQRRVRAGVGAGTRRDGEEIGTGIQCRSRLPLHAELVGGTGSALSLGVRRCKPE